MHYGPYGFASDQFRPTISTLDPHWQSTIGQRAGPSFLDFQSVNSISFSGTNAIFRLMRPIPVPNIVLGLCPTANMADIHIQMIAPVVNVQPDFPVNFAIWSSQLLAAPQFKSIQFNMLKFSPHFQLSTGQTLIFSPNHPSPFPSELDCIWLLKAPPGGNVFLQFVDQFLYNCEDTCDKSFVELKTGPDFRVTGYR
jgi:hypothetical protein